MVLRPLEYFDRKYSDHDPDLLVYRMLMREKGERYPSVANRIPKMIDNRIALINARIIIDSLGLKYDIKATPKSRSTDFMLESGYLDAGEIVDISFFKNELLALFRG